MTIETRDIKSILGAMLLTFAISVNAQQAEKPKKIYLIDEYFFHEIPVDYSLLDGLMSIETANGTKAFGLSLKVPLTEEAKKYAVPKKQIPEADILLEMFQEKRKQMLKLSVQKEEHLKVGDKFPQFQAIDIDGKSWCNADVEGKVMVLNCWFTGCGPCRAEMPELSSWKEEMPDVMFFSATYENPQTARPILEKTGFNWIALVNDTQFKEYIGANGYPMTIVIDKIGNIAQVEYGTSPVQREKIKQTIQSLR